MSKPIEYEIKSVRPKIVEVNEPFFILQFETTAETEIKLTLQRQTLEYLADEIGKMPRRPVRSD